MLIARKRKVDIKLLLTQPIRYGAHRRQVMPVHCKIKRRCVSFRGRVRRGDGEAKKKTDMRLLSPRLIPCKAQRSKVSSEAEASPKGAERWLPAGGEECDPTRPLFIATLETPLPSLTCLASEPINGSDQPRQPHLADPGLIQRQEPKELESLPLYHDYRTLPLSSSLILVGPSSSPQHLASPPSPAALLLPILFLLQDVGVRGNNRFLCEGVRQFSLEAAAT